MSSRRAFLTALSAARILGANDRIRLAGIGLGGRGRYLLQRAKEQGAEIVALSDVFEPRIGMARKQLQTDAPGFANYHAVLERKDVDGVMVGAPDHWHVPIAVDACRAGKDVYVEKPLTKTVEEGPLMERTVAETKRVVQVGYQQRSWEHFLAARELMPKLGKVSLVLASWYQNYLRYDRSAFKVSESEIDWKQWLGRAKARPLNPVLVFQWRWFWDFGGGHLTDLYSHYGDVIHWYLGLTGPRTVMSSGASHVLPDFECPDTLSTTWEYPGVTVAYQGTLAGHLEGGNIVFRGTKAMMKINRDGFAVYEEGKIPAELTRLPEPVEAMKSARDGTIAHVANFLECMRTRREPNAAVGPSAAIARAAHLGNRAYREKRIVTG